jgi:hypothetical protein
MTDQDQDRDPWEEFDRLKPAGPDRVEGYPGGEPLGFGWRNRLATGAPPISSEDVLG